MKHLSNHSSHRIQHIYDICMVRAPAFQIARLMECHFNQLADCFFLSTAFRFPPTASDTKSIP